tara:strand:- start:3069 stop:3407 length:339 start_codon:yes stop_codon:yes gene_type:complete
MVGHRCAICLRIAFPPDPYGCEKCGALATELDEFELEAKGSVRAVATVHRHHHPSPSTPFTVGVVELVAGPVLKAIVEGEAVAVGDSVIGVLVDGEDNDGNPVVDLHFQVVT